MTENNFSIMPNDQKKSSHWLVVTILVIVVALVAVGAWYVKVQKKKASDALIDKLTQNTDNGESPFLQKFGTVEKFPYEPGAELNDKQLPGVASTTLYIRKFDSTKSIEENLTLYIRYFANNQWLSSLGTSQYENVTKSLRAEKGDMRFDLTISKSNVKGKQSNVYIVLTKGVKLSPTPVKK